MELAPGVISRSRVLVSALGQETKVRIERGDHQAALEKIHEAIQLTGDLAASAEATVKDQTDLAHLHNEFRNASAADSTPNPSASPTIRGSVQACAKNPLASPTAACTTRNASAAL